MLKKIENEPSFASVNRGFNSVFKPNRLSVGLVVPIERYDASAVPTMERQLERIVLAETLGFSSVWLRDVPFNVPSFGDAGQLHDPFVYLGLLAGRTSRIALGVASIILPLRHPAHVAKAAASADLLSGGRLILGVASGDRPEEYPALGIDYGERGERFRQSYDYIRAVTENSPQFSNDFGTLSGTIDMLPKPASGRLPMLITGSSQQSSDWIAEHGDGWTAYPRPRPHQAQFIADYRGKIAALGLGDKPVMEPLYIDLQDDPDAEPRPIHLGLSLGSNFLVAYLRSRQAIGVNHIALNLRFNRADTERTLEVLARDVLPEFAQQEQDID